mgnify:CR=1 FL=1
MIKDVTNVDIFIADVDDCQLTDDFQIDVLVYYIQIRSFYNYAIAMTKK